jgi:hypothetical protein
MSLTPNRDAMVQIVAEAQPQIDAARGLPGFKGVAARYLDDCYTPFVLRTADERDAGTGRDEVRRAALNLVVNMLCTLAKNETPAGGDWRELAPLLLLDVWEALEGAGANICPERAVQVVPAAEGSA